MEKENQTLLRGIPKVDELLREEALARSPLPAALVRESVRQELDGLRAQVRSGACAQLPGREALCSAILKRARREALSTLRPVINGTGVVLHTNLGRACLSKRAAAGAAAVGAYSTLEYDVDRGERGSRHSHVEGLLCQVTGAQAAMVVNNNAAAVLLILSELGRGGEVITSRGELVEIGGSFRIPDIMVQCGCALREVGTTNKTHLQDYERAITPETRALLKVHTSNFKVLGFTQSVSLEEMVDLGRRYGLPVVQDLGSGSLVDLERFGLRDEPTVQHSVQAGVDVISFSGDKLLGGPQAGIIIGKKEYIDRFKAHPLARAVRVDKMTLAALRETLFSYTDPSLALEEIPTLGMLAVSQEALRARAGLLCQKLEEAGVSARVVRAESQVGGGSVPGQTMPSWAVALDPGKLTPDGLEARLRRRELPVIGRIAHETYLLDVRTLAEEEFGLLVQAAVEALA